MCRYESSLLFKDSQLLEGRSKDLYKRFNYYSNILCDFCLYSLDDIHLCMILSIQTVQGWLKQCRI